MKALIIILLLFSIGNISAIDIIDFQLSLEIGLMPKGHLKMYEFSRSIYRGMSFYGDFNFETQWFDNMLFIGVGAKIYLWKIKNTYQFSPDAVDFVFFAGVNISDGVILGYRHYCKHPIIPWINSSYLGSIWEQSLDEIYIKITLGNK